MNDFWLFFDCFLVDFCTKSSHIKWLAGATGRLMEVKWLKCFELQVFKRFYIAQEGKFGKRQEHSDYKSHFE